jgi:hypothetical protein
MSARFTEIPAAEFEKQFFADEIKESHRRDKGARQKASNLAAALNALLEVSGCPSDLHKGIHVLLDKSLGKAPDEPFYFNESEAGAHLPGEFADVTDGSKKKRWVRFWGEFEEWMPVSGKKLGQRERGYRIKVGRTEIMKGARYFSEVAQAVVDIERIAEGQNRRRKFRYHEAAIQVWNRLPPYIAPVEKAKVKTPSTNSSQPNRLAGKRSRAMERFEKAACQLLDENVRSGSAAVETVGARLVEKTVGLATAKLKEMAPDESPALALKKMFLAAARQILAEQQTGGEEAIDRALTELHAELEDLGAEFRTECSQETTQEEAGGVHIETFSLLKDNWTQTGVDLDSDGKTSLEKTAKNDISDFKQSQENQHLASKHLDTTVQMFDLAYESDGDGAPPLSPDNSVIDGEDWTV